MKTAQNQLQRQLEQPLAPVWIVSGDEPLLCAEASDSIRAACRKAGCEEREVYDVDQHFDWGRLHSAGHSLSLFASQRLIELRIPSGKPGDQGNRALLEWLELPPQDTYLLINLPKLDASTQKTKWAKSLIEHQCSRFVQIWPVDASQLPEWIRNRLGSAGLQASPEVIELLVNRVEGNLLAAAQEIEKLRLFSTSNVLELEAVTQQVADSARFDVFNLIDALLQGQPAHALRILQGLRSEGVAAPVVLWALGRELRSLAAMAHELSRGIPQERVFSSQRPPIWDKRKPLLAKALARHPAEYWENWLQLAQQADEQIKGQQPGDAWDSMTLLTAQASGLRLSL